MDYVVNFASKESVNLGNNGESTKRGNCLGRVLLCAYVCVYVHPHRCTYRHTFVCVTSQKWGCSPLLALRGETDVMPRTYSTDGSSLNM